jgi:hypothetical protein
VNGETAITGASLFWVVLLGAAMYSAMRWARKRLERIPLRKPRRRLINRVRPLAEALGTLAFLVASVRIVLGGHPQHANVVLGVIVVAVAWIGWFAVRDVVAGILLKAGETFEPGDWIEVGDIQGRVRRLGSRVVSLSTADGGQAYVPYGEITRSTLVRRPVTDGLFQHSFRVRLETGDEVVEGKGEIRRAALLSHWHSVAREPRIELNDDGTFTVTVFAVAPDQGYRIEKVVRAALRSGRFGRGDRRRGDETIPVPD